MLSGLVGCCPLWWAGLNCGCRGSAFLILKCVFENDLVGLDAAGTLAAAEAKKHTLITAETRRLEIAAHWADLHSGDAVPTSGLPGTQRPVPLGGDGTPTVGDFAPTELGCVLRISDGSASRLIADALDLRHRHRPRRKCWPHPARPAPNPAREPVCDQSEASDRSTRRSHPGRQLRNPRQPPQAATHSATPTSPRQSGAPRGTQRQNGELAQVCLAVRAVVEFVDSLCCGLPTSGPARYERAVMFAAHSAPGNLGA